MTRQERRSSRTGPRPTNRREPSKDTKARVVVATEGRVTEPLYLQAFTRMHGHDSIELVHVPSSSDPRSVVERVREEKTHAPSDGLSELDTYWAMFDRDDHDRFHEAVDMANANDIGLAISIPCFELWVLLHYEDWNRAEHRDALRRRLTRHCTGYTLGRKRFDDIEAIRDSHDQASDRARTLVRLRAEEDNPFGNPSTTVHCLTEHIRHGVKPA